MTTHIQLTKGKVAIIDDDDAELVSQYKWQARQDKVGNWYAETSFGGRKNKQHTSMHRLVMGRPKGMDVDHRSNDGLDNRKDNLRVCTRSENLKNRRAAKLEGASCRSKGVYLRKDNGRYVAKIKVAGRYISLGSCGYEPVAAHPEKKAAVLHFGEFASLNPL